MPVVVARALRGGADLGPGALALGLQRRAPTPRSGACRRWYCPARRGAVRRGRARGRATLPTIATRRANSSSPSRPVIRTSRATVVGALVDLALQRADARRRCRGAGAGAGRRGRAARRSSCSRSGAVALAGSRRARRTRRALRGSARSARRRGRRSRRGRTSRRSAGPTGHGACSSWRSAGSAARRRVRR